MSKKLKIFGLIIAFIGIGIMLMTIFESGSGTIQIGSETFEVPTVTDVEMRIPVMIGEAIVMFIGFGIFALGFKV
jgi:hypothetical protein